MSENKKALDTRRGDVWKWIAKGRKAMVNAASRRFPASSLVLRRQLSKLYETIQDGELRNRVRDARMILRIVPQARVMVVERFGSFLRLAHAGPQIFVPFLDRPRRVYWTGMPAGLTQIDLGEHSTDLRSQPLITKDNVTIAVDSTVFWQIVDPIKAVYRVGDLTGRLIHLSLTALRKVVGQLELNYALSSVEVINTSVREILDEATRQWGVTVTRVEIRKTSILEAPSTISLAFERYQKVLSCAGFSLRRQGLIFETLDGEQLLTLNPEQFFNPASVVKLATSAAAIERLGPDYRFPTRFYINGDLDRDSGELRGDLILLGSGDPAFFLENAFHVARELRELGVSRVRGNLIVKGPFYCNYSRNPLTAGATVKEALDRKAWTEPIMDAFDQFCAQTPAMRFESVLIDGKVVTTEDLSVEGLTLLFTHLSIPLVRILKQVNNYSDNWISDVVGSKFGGPDAVRDTLAVCYGLPRSAIHLETTSGVGSNRMRPMDVTSMLRTMFFRLAASGYSPADMMSVAGLDRGQLEERDLSPNGARSVLAKTGSLWGVSTLAGYIYTRNRGIIVFTIMNRDSCPWVFRPFQDLLVREILEISGGPAEIPNLRTMAG